MAQPHTSDVRAWQVGAHLSALCWIIGIPGVVGPLVVWLVQRERPEVEVHAKEALNFHLSVLIYGAALVVLSILLVVTIIGALLVPILIVVGLGLVLFELVLTILASVQASNGTLYRYPFNLRLIR